MRRRSRPGGSAERVSRPGAIIDEAVTIDDEERFLIGAVADGKGVKGIAERLVGQRTIVQRLPAPTADAAGGVRALTAATDAAAQEIAGWLSQQR